MCGRPNLLTAASRSSVLITALPFASCPVTMRLTSIAMSVLLGELSRTSGYSPGDRPCYFIGHGERGTDRQPALRPDPAAPAGEKGGVGDGSLDLRAAEPRRARGRAVMAEPFAGIGPFGRSKALGGSLSRLGAPGGARAAAARSDRARPPWRARGESGGDAAWSRRCGGARRHLEGSKNSVVAQPVAVEAAPAGAQSAAQVALRPNSPRAAPRGAVDTRSGGVAAEASRRRAGDRGYAAGCFRPPDRRGAPLPSAQGGAGQQVDQDCRRTRHIERLHMPAAADSHHFAAEGERRRVKAGFLVAEDQRNRAITRRANLR